MTSIQSKKQRIIRTFVSLILICSSFSVNVATVLASEITPEKMLELTNGSRIEAGLTELDFNEKLNMAAKAKAADMFRGQYFEHTSPDGITPWYWFDFVGYDYIYAAENLALDFTTAEGVHSALMKSTGHRENILCVNYREMGIAVISGTFKGRHSIIVVEEFGTEKEQRLIQINDPFFEETPAVDPEQEEPSVPENHFTQPSREELDVEDKKEEQDDIIIDLQEQANTILKIENEDTENNSISTEGRLGKVVPKAYSIRSSRDLKKVYVENIYWENADRGKPISLLDRNKLMLKALVRDLINGLLSDFVK